MLAVDLDELGQLLLLDLHVDVRVPVVVEDAEEPVDADVDARRLQERRIVRIDLDSALREAAGDRRVGEDHGAILGATILDPRGNRLGHRLRRAPPPPARAPQAPGPAPPPDRARACSSCSPAPRSSASPSSLSGSAGAASVVLEPVRSAMPASPFRSTLPEEIRGVHVTGAADEPARASSRSTSRSRRTA